MVTPTDLITAIRLSVSALKIHHAGINPDPVGVHSLRAGGGMSMKLHGASNNTIVKMGRLSSLTLLVYIHSRIGGISEGLAQTMIIPIPFLKISTIKT